MYHPWQAFRVIASVARFTLEWAHLPDGKRGHTDHDNRTVTLTLGMNQAERRSTIAHEVEHVRRGPVPAYLKAREERVVDDLAARRLIPFPRLVEALVWAYDDHELAEELWVDVEVVRARLDGLTAGESVELAARMDAAELRFP